MHFPKSLLAPLGAVVFLAAMAGPARAGLILDTVHGAYYFPDTSTIFTDGGTQVVNPTASFTLSSGAVNQLLTVSDTQILLGWDGSTSKNASTFNGVGVNTVGPAAPIVGVAIDLSSNLPVGFDSSFVSFSSTAVFINLAGLSVTADEHIVLDVSTAPEPSSFGLVALPIAALFLRRRLHRNRPVLE